MSLALITGAARANGIGAGIDPLHEPGSGQPFPVICELAAWKEESVAAQELLIEPYVGLADLPEVERQRFARGEILETHAADDPLLGPVGLLNAAPLCVQMCVHTADERAASDGMKAGGEDPVSA